MKKLISLALALAMVLGMVSFAMAETFELALVTDIGTIDDKSFNQGSWEGLVAYAEEKGISHKYYQPKEQANDAYLDAIQLAVDNGAKLIVTPGYLFETPVFIAQDMYPEVKFVLIDGNPNDGDWSAGAPAYHTAENTVGIVYAEEQSGFLAGYAVVKEGFTKFGFMGGMAVPAVVRFGYGFVQGVDYAAKELGLTDVSVNYFYTGGFAATPEAQAQAASWYSDGVEVIFACGGAVGDSVMAAAEAAEGKWVIGVDVDQGGQSERVITSAMKGLKASVYQAITAYYNDAFPGGEAWVLGADRDGVGLPMETSRFTKFTADDYAAIFDKLVKGEITLQKDTDAPKASDITVEIVKVSVIE